MSERKLYVGATAHCTIYIDQDDIRHLARISGNQSQVHVNWQTAVGAGFAKLVAQPALLEAYVESVIANHLGGQTLSNCRKTTHIEHYASPHAGERVCVAATIKAMAGKAMSYSVTVEAERGNLLAAGTIDIVRP